MRFVLKALLFASLCANLSAVDYPAAKQPGKANAEKQGNEIILSNNLMEMRWEQKNTTINPKMFSNKIEGKSYTQNTRKLISISTQKAKPIDTSKGIYLGIRLDANSVEALISADGKSWDLVKAFPHTLFPGKPSLIRLGKCSTKGDTSNYSTLGESGTSTFRELNVLNETGQSIISSFQSGGWKQIGVDEFDNITLNPDSMTISAPGNSGVAIEHSAPENMTLIKVLINKNSDKGMSWSPGIAV